MTARFLLAVAMACAAVVPPEAQQASPPCASAEHRQFDFWVGEWEVRAGDKFAGTNSIMREHGGCVLVERWTGVKGFTGTSLNVYVPSERRWHQTWADSAGTLLQLAGQFEHGAMRLASDAAEGAATLDRITWTPNTDGSVRQLWEQSKDGGTSWRVVFDGLYRRKAPDQAAAPRN